MLKLLVSLYLSFTSRFIQQNVKLRIDIPVPHIKPKYRFDKSKNKVRNMGNAGTTQHIVVTKSIVDSI